MRSAGTNLIACLLLLLGACGGEEPPAEELPSLTPPDSLVFSHVLGDSTTFGSIDAVASSESRVFVLDRVNKVVHVYSAEGEEVGQLGGEGEGPGELSWPTSMALDPSGAVLVLDQRNGRIERYTESRTGDFEATGSIPLGFQARDFCLLGDRLFVSGNHQGSMVHELDTQGELLRSFAVSSQEHPILQTVEASGRLWCDAATETVLHVPLTFPRLRAFEPDGNPLWATDLSDYHQLNYDFSGGGIRPGMDAEGMAHQLEGLGFLAADTLLVQLHLLADGKVVGLESRAISILNGAQIADLNFPGRIVQVSGPRVFIAVEDPFPELGVFSRAGG